jgi:hypothetical protein
MSRTYTVRPDAPLVLDKPVVVSGPSIEVVTVDGSEIWSALGEAGLQLNAGSTARVIVTYLEEVGDEKIAEIRREAEAEAEAA